MAKKRVCMGRRWLSSVGWSFFGVFVFKGYWGEGS